jgi:hypothetical protein
MDIPTPQTVNRGVNLDNPPPRPPGSEGKGLMQTSIPAPTEGKGLGSMAKSPVLMTMQGMELVEQGFNLLGAANPNAAQFFSNSVADLKKMLPQIMADQMGGTSQMGGPAGAQPVMPMPPGGPGAPGMPPGGPPAQPGPMGGGMPPGGPMPPR